MDSLYRETGLPASSADAALDDDRRYNQRNRFLTGVRIRRLDVPQDERVGATQDLSRDGLYFVVRSRDYAVGMRLVVTLLDAKSEWTCEVVRTEQLPNGGQGVGVIRVGSL